MKIAVTGATGFLGRYLVAELQQHGHQCRCWHRPTSNRDGFEQYSSGLEWTVGELGDEAAANELVQGCDAIVHAALMRSAANFRGGDGEVVEFVRCNLLGTLQLVEAARRAGVGRFVFVSTCAVHERILTDRPLDETHPLWPMSHYGAHKAAIEKFVHSFGMGLNFPICALRPTGIYGVARPVEHSKWFELVRQVARGERVECQRGGKEVHAADVARAVSLLLTADGTSGEAYNCYDLYISEYEVATITKEITGSQAEIMGKPTQPKNQIQTDKIRRLGMEFGGRSLLKSTVEEMV